MRDREEKQKNEESDEKGSSSSTSSSSPSHEFSFTISFHDNKEISPSSNFALDLSPADDIFFHGHLLPLHLLSHLPISPPRSSTNSNHTYTFPIKHDQDTHTSKGKTKSLFGLPKQTKLKFDHVAQVVKKYIRMARPLLSFTTSKKNMQMHRQAYSYSGNLKLRGEKKLQYSAPASIRTSPTNSGLLVPKPTGTSSSSDSTTEELQASIQAAIAHCKKSFSMDDKVI